MAIPTTGSVALLDTEGNDRSIAYNVLGNAAPTKLYSSLVGIAGFSMPKSYTSWRGYSSGSTFSVTTTSSTTPEISVSKSTFFGKLP